ncbi:hypothetical protein OROMI_022518 [Orobanche minor]
MSRKVENSSVWSLVLLILVVAPMSRVSAISCMDAITKLMPCQPFLLDRGNGVTVPCCQGAESLSQMVGSKPDELKTTCQCFKQAAAAMGVNVTRAQQLPQLCKISVPVPIDPNINCSVLLMMHDGSNEARPAVEFNCC